MKKTVPMLIAGAALAGIALPSLAQEPGNARHGRQVAEMTCAECHAVERGRIRSKNGHAPTFESIAMTRGMNAMALRVALKTSHREMPNLMLSDSDTDDVIAYIQSLTAPNPAGAGRQGGQ